MGTAIGTTAGDDAATTAGAAAVTTSGAAVGAAAGTAAGAAGVLRRASVITAAVRRAIRLHGWLAHALRVELQIDPNPNPHPNPNPNPNANPNPYPYPNQIELQIEMERASRGAARLLPTAGCAPLAGREAACEAAAERP